MRTRSKFLLTALAAALVMAAAVGTANARRFETSSQSFRVVWPSTSRLTFSGLGGSITIACQVTLEGSFHSRTISKVRGQLVGYVTSANLTRPCAGGEAWILNGVERPTNSLPWHIRYDSFVGTLPNISRIRLQLVGAAFLIEAATILGQASCLFRSTAEEPAFGFINLAAGVVSTLSADETSEIPLETRLSGPCTATGQFRGSGNVTVQNSTTRITVRLVQ